MTTSKRKGPIYNTLNDTERLLRARGVPSRYLRYTTSEAIKRYDKDAKNNESRLNTLTYEKEWIEATAKDRNLNISMQKQKQILTGIFNHNALAETSTLLGVGSYPTEHLGLRFGAAVCRRATDLKLRVRMINARNNISEKDKDKDKIPDVVVIYNAPFDSSPPRIAACRDWINFFDDTFVVVITAGVDPITFFYHRLRMRPDSALDFRER